MNAMPELNDLRRQWQTQPQPAADVAALRQHVASDTRTHTRTLVIVAIGTLLVIAATVVKALRSDEAGAWFGVLFTSTYAVLVWLVAMWLSRGTWRPRDESIAAHLDVSIRRCRSVIIAAPVGIALYVAGLIGSLIWRQRLLGVEWHSASSASPTCATSAWNSPWHATSARSRCSPTAWIFSKTPR